MIKTEIQRIENIPYRSSLLQDIPLLEMECIELANSIGILKKNLSPHHDLNEQLENKMSLMSFKTNQLLMYK